MLLLVEWPGHLACWKSMQPASRRAELDASHRFSDNALDISSLVVERRSGIIRRLLKTYDGIMTWQFPTNFPQNIVEYKTLVWYLTCSFKVLDKFHDLISFCLDIWLSSLPLAWPGLGETLLWYEPNGLSPLMAILPLLSPSEFVFIECKLITASVQGTRFVPKVPGQCPVARALLECTQSLWDISVLGMEPKWSFAEWPACVGHLLLFEIWFVLESLYWCFENHTKLNTVYAIQVWKLFIHVDDGGLGLPSLRKLYFLDRNAKDEKCSLVQPHKAKAWSRTFKWFV